MADLPVKSTSVPGATSKSSEELAGFLRARIGGVLGVPEDAIDLAVPADSYGLSSTEAVILAGELATFIDRELPAQILLGVSSLEVLVQQLTNESSSGD